MSAEASARELKLTVSPGTPVGEFLMHLRERVRHIPACTPRPDGPLSTLRAVAESEDLPARFAKEAVEAGCSVHRTTTGNWIRVVQEVLRGHEARKVLIEPQPATALTAERAAALRAALASAGVAVVSEHDDETLFSVEAAVTGVAAAIAETGTLVCPSGPSAARGASLIPPVHVAVVAAAQLIADLFDYFEQLSGTGTLPANINLITGPSKTADIEGILVTGVHGPGHVHIVLME